MSENETAHSFRVQSDASSVLAATQAGATLASFSAPGSSDGSLPREPFIEIDDIRVVNSFENFTSYALDFTLHCDSLPERDLWKDHPVWPALRSLTLLTAHAYSRQIHIWEKGKEHLSRVRAAQKAENDRAEHFNLPKPFRLESVERGTPERFDLQEAFNQRTWEAFVEKRISEPDFETGIVKTVRCRHNLIGSLVESLGGYFRSQQGSRAELEGTLQLVSGSENSEKQRLYLVLTKVETGWLWNRAPTSPSHCYHFSARVGKPTTRGTVFSIKTEAGPAIDLLDFSKSQDEGAED